MTIARRVLGSVRERVTVLVAVATVPVVLTAVWLAYDASQAGSNLVRYLLAISVSLAAELAILTFGISRTLVRPLRELTRAVEHWRGGDGFGVGALSRTAPTEVAELRYAFSHVAASLADREGQLRGALAQQELLMQEIHHRVKNNLQIVASLLNLQATRIRLPEARAEFQAAGDRVRALATLHRHLYAEGELRSINMRSFLAELCGQLFQAMGEREGGRIQLTIDATDLHMSSDQAVPLSLIVTEAVSNAMKYAFPGERAGHIAVGLSAHEHTARLTIEDDGVGIPDGAGESETGPRDGLGIQLIRGFSRQLGATLVVQHETGTRYEVEIPLHRERSDAEPASAAAAAAD